jgi:hypothetical protein
MFERKQGYKLDLDNPKTLNEKIQWLKIHDRKPLYTICADKYAIRDYISEKFGDKYLIPLVMHTSDVKQLNANNLPNYPFIIKANHDSGNYKIIRDKNNVDWAKQQLICKSWLLNNYFPVDREWQYKNIKPQIVVEKLLIQKDGKIPNDYNIGIKDDHHKKKIDYPSGTALMLANAISKGKNKNPELIRGKTFLNKKGNLQKNKINFFITRKGKTIGKHSVLFNNKIENIELTHTAFSRELFADGALKAAIWISKKNKGLFNMQDMFKLK